MTSSEKDLHVQELLDRTLSLLEKDRIVREIERPIDAATGRFRLRSEGSLTHSAFNRVIARFVQALYARALRVAKRLGMQDAHCEAVMLLERHYRGVWGTGYDAAYLDAVSGQAGAVLLRLAALIKQEEKRKYLQWVQTTVDCLDWQTKEHMVRAYIARYGSSAPDIRDMPPERLAGHLSLLLHNHVTVHTSVTDILRS